MTKQNTGTVHLGDEEFVCLLDGEGDATRLDGWREHLADCMPCAERYQELESAGIWLREGIALLETPAVNDMARARALAAARRAAAPGPSRSAAGYFKAAAAVFLIVAVGMTVDPLRAWVLDLAGISTPAAPVAQVEDAAPVASALVSFAPTERIFVIELDERQAAGDLRIEVGDGAAASAQILGAGAESFSVLPAGLLIDNGASSTASYLVELPGSMIRTVRVEVAGTLVSEVAVVDGVASARVELASAPGQ